MEVSNEFEKSYLIKHPGIDVVATDSQDAVLISRILRQRKGALIPLVTGDLSESYVHTMMREKTITINTTAAGGNASLLIAAADPGHDKQQKNKFVA